LFLALTICAHLFEFKQVAVEIMARISYMRRIISLAGNVVINSEKNHEFIPKHLYALIVSEIIKIYFILHLVKKEKEKLK
jgi:hypothetical protein